MIRVMCDPYSLAGRTKETVVVSDTTQFVACRLAIRNALRARRPLDVVVASRQAAAWFGSLRSYPGVTFTDVVPSEELRKKLANHCRGTFEPPLSDREVMELDLVAKAESCPPMTVLSNADDVRTWVLSVCVDPVWADTTGSPAHVAHLASHLLGRGFSKCSSAAEKLRAERVQAWSTTHLGKLYQWLLKDPVERAFLLYTWQVCRQYSNTMRDKVLREYSRTAPRELAHMAELVKSVTPVSCPETTEARPKLERRLESLWTIALNERLRTSTSSGDSAKVAAVFNMALAEMSGLMQGELSALMAFAKEHSECLTRDMCDQAAAKFAWASSQLDELRADVPPPYPIAPDGDWAWSVMRDWVTRRYLPYRKWLLAQEKQDLLVDGMAEIFSKWVFERYPTLKNGVDPLVYGTWSRILGLVQEGRQVLWIIIDNLAGLWFDEVIKAFRDEGFFVTSEPQWMVAMFPSETATSKSALVAGRLPNQIPEQELQKYLLLFTGACRDRGVSGRFIRDEELKRSRLGEEQVTCWITNRLDTEGHKGYFDIQVGVASLLKAIAGRVRKFVPGHTTSERFCLVISTDHGSCGIPRGSKCIQIPKGTTSDMHRRHVETLVAMPADDNWFVLDTDRFALHRPAVAVRGYAYIGKGLPVGLIHGGLLPEEVVIPHVEFSLARTEPVPLECIHSGKPIMGARRQRSEFLVRNFNSVPVTDVIVGFPTISLELKVDGIAAKGEATSMGELNLREDLARSALSEVTVAGQGCFRCRGEVVRGPAEVMLHVRHLMEGPGEAEQLLGI